MTWPCVCASRTMSVQRRTSSPRTRGRPWNSRASPRSAGALRSRLFQFLFIVPNQVIFWLVIIAGVLGLAHPTRNFATVITWYIWFAVVFLLMVGPGRAWCLMCPFGDLAEWVQRLSLWKRHPRAPSTRHSEPSSARAARRAAYRRPVAWWRTRTGPGVSDAHGRHGIARGPPGESRSHADRGCLAEVWPWTTKPERIRPLVTRQHDSCRAT